MVVTAPSSANKLLRALLHLADVCFHSGDGLVCCILTVSSGSFEDLDLVGEFFCPSLVFFGAGTGDDAVSGEALGRSAYQYSEESGWWYTCNCLGGLVPVSVALSSDDLGCRRCLRRQVPCFSATRWWVVIFYS